MLLIVLVVLWFVNCGSVEMFVVFEILFLWCVISMLLWVDMRLGLIMFVLFLIVLWYDVSVCLGCSVFVL